MPPQSNDLAGRLNQSVDVQDTPIQPIEPAVRMAPRQPLKPLEKKKAPKLIVDKGIPTKFKPR